MENETKGIMSKTNIKLNNNIIDKSGINELVVEILENN